MAIAVVLAQGLPLWAVLLTLIQNQNPRRFPAGIASPAMPFAGCEPTHSMLFAPPPSTRRELLRPIRKRSASRPAAGSDAAVLAFDLLLVR